MSEVFYERRTAVDNNLCNERHKVIDEWREDIKRDIRALFVRLNWFYVIAIATLATVVANFFKG